MATPSRFDEAAAQWDNNPVRIELARAIGAEIRRVIPLQSQWRALDFGAGTGLVTLSLQPYVASIVAVDTSAGMLEVLGEKLSTAQIGNVKTRQWDLQGHEFPETGFDFGFSSMTFHHVENVPLVLKRLAGLLKPNGWLAIADLDAENGSFHGPNSDVYHNGFAREQIQQWLVEAGFGEITIRDAHTIKKTGADGKERSYGVFLAVGRTL